MPPAKIKCFEDASSTWSSFTGTSEAKNWFAGLMYNDELQTIKRHPIVDSRNFGVIKLDVYDSTKDPKRNARQQNVARKGVLIEIEDDGRDYSKHELRYDPIVDSRAGSSGRDRGRDLDLQYDPIQDISHGYGGAGRRTASSAPLEVSERGRREMQRVYAAELEAAKQDYLTFGIDLAEADKMTMLTINNHWLKIPAKEGQDAWKENNHLYSGFPMVERVTYLKHSNTWAGATTGAIKIAPGHCYWTAVALLIYGNALCWLRVKAEHLNFLESVLRTKEHPRHAHYTRVNSHRSQTVANGPEGIPVWRGDVNMLEGLKRRACWVSDEMCGLTADIYDVFVVLYKMNETHGEAFKELQHTVYNMRTYGGFNQRHIFLCYTNEDHFCPMIPNDYLHTEFRLPRITLASTRKYNLVTSGEHRQQPLIDGRGHYARCEPNVVSPPLARPRFTQADLYKVVDFEKFFTEPARPPSLDFMSSFNDSDFIGVVTPGRGLAPSGQPTTPAPGRSRIPGTPGTGFSARVNDDDDQGVDLSQPGKDTPRYVSQTDKTPSGKGKGKVPASTPPSSGKTPSSTSGRGRAPTSSPDLFSEFDNSDFKDVKTPGYPAGRRPNTSSPDYFPGHKDGDYDELVTPGHPKGLKPKTGSPNYFGDFKDGDYDELVKPGHPGVTRPKRPRLPGSGLKYSTPRRGERNVDPPEDPNTIPVSG